MGKGIFDGYEKIQLKFVEHDYMFDCYLTGISVTSALRGWAGKEFNNIDAFLRFKCDGSIHVILSQIHTLPSGKTYSVDHENYNELAKYAFLDL